MNILPPVKSEPHVIIAENLRIVRERIAEAAVNSGRNASDITLVGVSKYVDAELTCALAEAGCACLGESRPQQLWHKSTYPGLQNVAWHLIGHLQRNKVEKTIPLVELVHSVDSLRLLQSIDSFSLSSEVRTRVLLEVNISGDPSKHGFSPQELVRLVGNLPELQATEIRGLMTMASLEGGNVVAEKNFQALFSLREQIREMQIPGLELPELSMGMSADFEEAIRAGATIVRIGSILFSGLAS